MRTFFVAVLSSSLAAVAADTDRAMCPVTGVNITDLETAPALTFSNGQQLYFGSEDALAAYKGNPRAYWLSPFETPLPGMDGKKGLPDLSGETRYCPYSNETMVIDMKTPRVVHRWGQNVYFCCFGCVSSFWTAPETAWDGSGAAWE